MDFDRFVTGRRAALCRLLNMAGDTRLGHGNEDDHRDRKNHDRIRDERCDHLRIVFLVLRRAGRRQQRVWLLIHKYLGEYHLWKSVMAIYNVKPIKLDSGPSESSR